jgi:hypothetical protein
MYKTTPARAIAGAFFPLFTTLAHFLDRRSPHNARCIITKKIPYPSD